MQFGGKTSQWYGKEENVWFRSGKFLRAVVASWARLGSAFLHWEHVPSDADCCTECSESS